MADNFIAFGDPEKLFELENGIICYRIAIGFSNIGIFDEEITIDVQATFNYALDELHKHLPDDGMFRYILRSNHLPSNSVGLQTNFFFFKIDGKIICENFTGHLEVNTTSMLFKDDLVLEVMYLPTFKLDDDDDNYVTNNTISF